MFSNRCSWVLTRGAESYNMTNKKHRSINAFVSTFRADRELKSDVIIHANAIHLLAELAVFHDMNKDSNHILLTDQNIAQLYLKPIQKALQSAGLNVYELIIAPGEASKSVSVYTKLIEQILDFGIDKHSVVISLGGGIVNNIAGFLASTLYRGIGLIHIPTSLLAQADAAIDFKQAVNFRHGKNLIGSYYPAQKIIVDPLVLQTLDIRHIRNGLGESIKHALCQDADFLDYLLSRHEELTDQDFLNTVVATTIKLKLEVMTDNIDAEYDEMLKQYGHSIGHAVEHLSNGQIYHGEAIAIGMCASARIGHMLGLSSADLIDIHEEVFTHFGLPVKIPAEFSREDIWNKIRYDKHFLSDLTNMGILQSVGVLAQNEDGGYAHSISQDIVFQAIEASRPKYHVSTVRRK